MVYIPPPWPLYSHCMRNCHIYNSFDFMDSDPGFSPGDCGFVSVKRWPLACPVCWYHPTMDCLLDVHIMQYSRRCTPPGRRLRWRSWLRRQATSSPRRGQQLFTELNNVNGWLCTTHTWTSRWFLCCRKWKNATGKRCDPMKLDVYVPRVCRDLLHGFGHRHWDSGQCERYDRLIGRVTVDYLTLCTLMLNLVFMIVCLLCATIGRHFEANLCDST